MAEKTIMAKCDACFPVICSYNGNNRLELHFLSNMIWRSVKNIAFVCNDVEDTLY